MILHGICASEGISIGEIVNTKKLNDIQKKKYILVTKYFTPDMLVQFKDASAIISENGGFTCHAAIIARTMALPCVVGVKDATKVLSSGMYVSVKALKLTDIATIEVIN